jgi:hypothetical protein
MLSLVAHSRLNIFVRYGEPHRMECYIGLVFHTYRAFKVLD